MTKQPANSRARMVKISRSSVLSLLRISHTHTHTRTLLAKEQVGGVGRRDREGEEGQERGGRRLQRELDVTLVGSATSRDFIFLLFILPLDSYPFSAGLLVTFRFSSFVFTRDPPIIVTRIVPSMFVNL